MSKVFVIQATRNQVDVSPAKVYGDIVFILTAADRSSSDATLPCKKLERALKQFNVDEDYILWSGGDPLSCMLTGYVLSNLGVRTFRYLRYEKREGRNAASGPFYVPVAVTPFPPELGAAV